MSHTGRPFFLPPSTLPSLCPAPSPSSYPLAASRSLFLLHFLRSFSSSYFLCCLSLCSLSLYFNSSLPPPPTDLHPRCLSLFSYFFPPLFLPPISLLSSFLPPLTLSLSSSSFLPHFLRYLFLFSFPSFFLFPHPPLPPSLPSPSRGLQLLFPYLLVVLFLIFHCYAPYFIPVPSLVFGFSLF